MICLRPLDGEYDWSARCQLRPGTQPQPPAEATDALSCMGLSMGTLSWHCVVRHSSTRDGPRGVQEARVLEAHCLGNRLRFHKSCSSIRSCSYLCFCGLDLLLLLPELKYMKT